MSERYVKLFSFEEKFYTEGSPVVISAGMLSKDSQTGNVFAQIKLQNITSEKIKAATVGFTPLDTLGNVLGEDIKQQYLDLDVSYGDFFAQKQPVIFSDNNTRGFIVYLSEVIFKDNTVWKSNDKKWEKLEEPVVLTDKFADAEVVKQYKVNFGLNSKYVYSCQKDLWYCSCGALNKTDRESCIGCGLLKEKIENLDALKLKEQADERIAEEKAKAEKQAIEDAEKSKKFKKVTLSVFCIAVVVIVISAFVISAVNKKNIYNTAFNLVEQHKYDEAIESFAYLGDYKDSKEMSEYGVKYEEALYFLENKNFSSAKELFKKLGNYKDSENYAENEVDYQQALYLLSSSDEKSSVKALFEKLGDYKDSKEYVSKFVLTVVEREYYLGTQRVTQTFEYDKKGRIISERIDTNNLLKLDVTYKENTSISARLYYVSYYDKVTMYSIETDEKGLWTNYTADNGEPAKRYQYKYDSKDNVDTVIIKLFNDNVLYLTVTIKYTQHEFLGRVISSVSRKYVTETEKNATVTYAYKKTESDELPYSVLVSGNDGSRFNLEYDWIYAPDLAENNSNLNFITDEFFLTTYG